MSKIETDGYFSSPRRSRGDRKRAKGVEGGFFSSLLGRSDQTESPQQFQYSLESDESVESLLDTVHGLGEQLKKDARRQTLLEYKEAVRRFLGFVVSHGVAVEEHVSGHNIMRRKRFSIVAVVDEQLERLGAGVLQSQQDQLEILRRVDEIYGLLIDLVR